mgnify:CR=1 FL=1
MANHDIWDESSGVSKKIRMQIDAFRKMGISLDAPNLFSNTNIDKVIRRIPFAKSKFDKSVDELIDVSLDNYDFVYIRHPFFDFFFYKSIQKISRQGLPIIYEFPTFPYDRNGKGLKWNLTLIKDKLFRNKIYKFVDIGVDYSGYQEIFKIPCISISNGIDPSYYTKRQKKICNTKFVFLGVALLTYWNGYDRLIKSIKLYQKNYPQLKIEFHIAGDGDELHNLMELTASLELKDNVIFHGFVSNNELKKLYDICDVAVGTLSPSRKYKNHIMSTLKTKEYTAIGVPFIKGDKDQAFDNFNLDFVYNVPDNESLIDIPSIINWYNELISNYGNDTLTDHIRTFGFEYLTWEKQLLPVIDYLRLKKKGS